MTIDLGRRKKNCSFNANQKYITVLELGIRTQWVESKIICSSDFMRKSKESEEFSFEGFYGSCLVEVVNQRNRETYKILETKNITCPLTFLNLAGDRFVLDDWSNPDGNIVVLLKDKYQQLNGLNFDIMFECDDIPKENALLSDCILRVLTNGLDITNQNMIVYK